MYADAVRSSKAEYANAVRVNNGVLAGYGVAFFVLFLKLDELDTMLDERGIKLSELGVKVSELGVKVSEIGDQLRLTDRIS